MDTPTANTLLTYLYLSAYTLVIAGRQPWDTDVQPAGFISVLQAR